MSWKKWEISSLLHLTAHFILLLILFCFDQYWAAKAFSFSFSSFNSHATNIHFEGDAKSKGGVIDLNRVDQFHSVGLATFVNPVRIWNASTGSVAHFSTRFSFTVQKVNSTDFADGFAFFLAPVGYKIQPNSTACCFGLFNKKERGLKPQNQVVMVEFDSCVNEDWDPNIQHVGINNNSLNSSSYAYWGVEAHNAKKTNVWITYNATTMRLTVSWSNDEELHFARNSSVFCELDLTTAVHDIVKIGFAASTGEHIQRNIIHSWQFESHFEDEEVTTKKPRTRETLWFVVAACSLSFSALGLLIGWMFAKWSRKVAVAEKATRTVSMKEEIRRDALSKEFSYEELETATNNFSEDRKLGEGGSGQVYKGFLSNKGLIVAVKRILAHSEVDERLFINEVMILSRLMHKNLVRFIGFCDEKGKLLVVYEFMHNGSLDEYLFGNRKPLSWNARYDIALGLALAVQYLHELSKPYILHRDIKPANVLLDIDFSAKLGDFGIAKLMDTRLITEPTNPVGTLGYVAPEYQKHGKASKESDMFSFGVVALEIACGRRNFRNGDSSRLVKEVWTLYKAGSIFDAADNRLNKNFDRRGMECLIIVGLWCTHPRGKERPSVGQVIQFLKFEAPLPELPQMVHDPLFTQPVAPVNWHINHSLLARNATC